MKIRSGFVSNSSSSSFVCDVCGEDASGWDLCLREAEMYECANGHIFCESHAKEVSLEDKQKMALKWMEEDGENDEEIVEGVTSGDEGWVEDTYYNYFEEKDLRYEYPAETCPCCNLSNPTSDQLLEYALYKLKTKSDDLKKQLKDEFGTWNKFVEETK